MRYAAVALLLACMVMPFSGQEKTDGPQDEKAQKTYKDAFQYLKQRKPDAALENFKKSRQAGWRPLSAMPEDDD